MKLIKYSLLTLFFLSPMQTLASEESTETKSVAEATLPEDVETAIEEGDIKTIRKYIAKKGDIEVKIEMGWTPLMLAANTDLKIFNFLISHGANVHAKDEYGNTILHLALHDKNTKDTEEIITTLVNKNLNINEQNKSGETALMHALDKLDYDAITLLVKHGAGETIKDKKNMSPLDYAKEKKVIKEFNEALSKARKLYIE